MIQKKSALGRGLDALFAADNTATSDAQTCEVSIDAIKPNPDQPRRDFDPQALEELAQSMANVGVIQPIALRPQQDGTYTIIAGERRWRAAQLAGLTTIPAYIHTDAADDDVVQMALIENIQRQDLNPIEVAQAYQAIIDRCNLTQDDLAKRVGKNRTTVANTLRLLKLPDAIRRALKAGTISSGHARAMIPLDDPQLQLQLFEVIGAKGLSVRQVEILVRDFMEGKISDFCAPASKAKPDVDQTQAQLIEAMAGHLRNLFNASVRMSCNDKGQGKITIPFKNDAELQHIMALLDGIREDK